MGKKPLTVLVVTRSNDSEKDVAQFREQVAKDLPPGTVIHYAMNGNASAGAFTGMKVRQARHSDYDYVLLSAEIVDHFGTPAVVDRAYMTPKKSYRASEKRKKFLLSS